MKRFKIWLIKRYLRRFTVEVVFEPHNIAGFTLTAKMFDKNTGGYSDFWIHKRLSFDFDIKGKRAFDVANMLKDEYISAYRRESKND